MNEIEYPEENSMEAISEFLGKMSSFRMESVVEKPNKLSMNIDGKIIVSIL